MGRPWQSPLMGENLECFKTRTCLDCTDVVHSLSFCVGVCVGVLILVCLFFVYLSLCLLLLLLLLFFFFGGGGEGSVLLSADDLKL